MRPLVPSVQVAGVGSTLETQSSVKWSIQTLRGAELHRAFPPLIFYLPFAHSVYLSLSFIFFVLQASQICPPKRHRLFLCFAPAENSHLSISVLKRELLIQLLLLNKQGHLGQCTVCFDHTAFLCVLQQIICVVFPGVVSLKALTMCFIPSGLKQNLVAILSNVN